MFESIDDAIGAIRVGGVVVVVDDEDRENEGDLIMAAEAATEETIAFFVLHTSGVICAPMPGEDLDRLNLPPMVERNEDPKGTAFAITVDAVERVSTGISAEDRARTLRVLADPDATPSDLTRPGHIFPLRYHPSGVLRRPGHTEAAVDLARLAGLRPVGVLSELVNPDGTMARLRDCRRFSDEHGLPLVTIADLVAYRRGLEGFAERLAETRLARADGTWRLVTYASSTGEYTHVAAVLGDLDRRSNVPVRLHAACVLGDVFRGNCASSHSLDSAMEWIAQAGHGVVIYTMPSDDDPQSLRCPSARDHDDIGAVPGDVDVAAMIVADLGISTIRLLADDPTESANLRGWGLPIASVETLASPHAASVSPLHRHSGRRSNEPLAWGAAMAPRP